MAQLWAIASMTFKEGIRNRAMYGISILALIMMIANLLISSMIMQEVGKVAVDMALSAASFAGLLLVLFVGINLLAKDLDRKTIYMVLSRPLSRSQYIVGKFLGIALLVTASMVLLSIFAAASIYLVKLTCGSGYFPRFSWPLVALSLAFNTLMLLLLSSLTFLFASFTSTSFISLMLTIASYLIGNSINDVKDLVTAPQGAGITPSPVIVKVVEVAYYAFPNLSLFDIKTQVAHGISPSGAYVFWTIAYGVVYTCLAVAIACAIFSRREFP